MSARRRSRGNPAAPLTEGAAPLWARGRRQPAARRQRHRGQRERKGREPGGSRHRGASRRLRRHRRRDTAQERRPTARTERRLRGPRGRRRASRTEPDGAEAAETTTPRATTPGRAAETAAERRPQRGGWHAMQENAAGTEQLRATDGATAEAKEAEHLGHPRGGGPGHGSEPRDEPDTDGAGGSRAARRGTVRPVRATPTTNGHGTAAGRAERRRPEAREERRSQETDRESTSTETRTTGTENGSRHERHHQREIEARPPTGARAHSARSPRFAGSAGSRPAAQGPAA